MNLSLPVIIVALPLVSALLLALISSWQVGTWVNAAASTLLFLLICLLPWQSPDYTSLLIAGAPETALTLLTGLVAMTTSWFSLRYIPAALAQRLINRFRSRIYHVAFQAFVGALLCALLSDNWVLTWLMLLTSIAAGVVLIALPLTEPALTAAWRMLLHCCVALVLTLFGMLALHQALQLDDVSVHWSALSAARHVNPAALDLACIFLILGCGALAGLLPPQSLLPDATTEAAPPGAILLSALLVNVPLLIILRLRVAAAASSSVAVILIVSGLASLLLAACSLSSRPDARRMVAFIGASQSGLVVLAFGLGTPTTIFAGVLLMTLFSLARASALQCQGLAPTQLTQWTCAVSLAMLSALPLFALLLIAGASIAWSPWLMLPLAVGVLLVTWALVGHIRASGLLATGTMSGNQIHDVLTFVPVWVQLAITALLAVALPYPMVAWCQFLVRAN